MRTLVLNAGFEPMQLICWKRAICLIISEKAEIVSEYAEQVRTVSKSFQLPSVIRLHKYVHRMHQINKVKCTRKNILLRDQYECQYCSIKITSTNATLDHVIPRSKGGPATWENLVAACKKCNLKKGSKTPESVGLTLRRKPRRPLPSELIKQDRNAKWDSWYPLVKQVFM